MGRIVGLEILNKVKPNKKKPAKNEVEPKAVKEDEAAAETLEEVEAEPEKCDAKKSEK